MRVFLLAVVLALVVVPSAAAKRHHKIDPELTCDGVNCTYFANGLAPDTPYMLVFESGCDGSFNGPVSDSSGAITFRELDEAFMCTTPGGTLTVWLQTEDSLGTLSPIPGTTVTVQT